MIPILLFKEENENKIRQHVWKNEVECICSKLLSDYFQGTRLGKFLICMLYVPFEPLYVS
jgi:hypothetical protein